MGLTIAQLPELTETMAEDDYTVMEDTSEGRTKKIKAQHLGIPSVGTVTGTYTVAGNNLVIFATGTFTITLGAASKKWRTRICNKGTGVITVVGPGADTIQGNASIKLTSQYDTVDLIGDGVATHVEF